LLFHLESLLFNINNNTTIVENDINDVIIEYIKSESGLGKVPEQYRDKLYRIAYERGHSSGFYEVYQELCELVDIFN